MVLAIFMCHYMKGDKVMSEKFDAHEALKADFGIGKEESDKLEEELYVFVAKKTLDVTMQSMKLTMETEILKQQIKKDDDNEPTDEAKERMKQFMKNNDKLARYVGQLDILSEISQFMSDREKK